MAVDGNLNDKQQRFVAAYVEGLDPHKAALAAGYKPRGARRHGERLLGQRPIVEAIARRAGGGPAPSPARTPVTRAWITEELTDLYKTVKACLAGSGEQGGKAPSGASLQSVIKTLELLIKHLEAAPLSPPCHLQFLAVFLRSIMHRLRWCGGDIRCNVVT